MTINRIVMANIVGLRCLDWYVGFCFVVHLTRDAHKNEVAAATQSP
jgi:hypothetical protein